MAIASRSGALRFFNYLHRAGPASSFMCINECQRQCKIQHSWVVRSDAYSSDSTNHRTIIGMGPTLNPKKKKVFIPRVTLLSEDDEMSIVTLEAAAKIADRRNLKLVKILDFDTKTERPTYKLMTSKQYLHQEFELKKLKKLDRETSLKPEKMLSLSTKISPHDMQTKLNGVLKFLKKRHDVRILITVDDNRERAEAIVTQIETMVKDLAPKIKKSVSNNNFKVYLHPNIKKILENAKNETTEENNDETSIDLEKPR